VVPLTEKRRQTIFSVIMKSKPELSSFCLSIPSIPFQSQLLLGWSAEITNELWKRRCKVDYEDEAFNEFLPPTIKKGKSVWNSLTKPFVVSKKLFKKKVPLFFYSFTLS
jgi:hypothetical protein